jgi:hypothetical protein
MSPELTFEGTSGIYYLFDQDSKQVGVFKPLDEEPFGPNNPRGFLGDIGTCGFRKGIRSGESAQREVFRYYWKLIAYHLDKDEFFNVPLTSFVEIHHQSFNSIK